MVRSRVVDDEARTIASTRYGYDPLFAKNRFWDVGHAEGSGETGNREIQKIATIQGGDLFEQIQGMDG